MHLRYALLGLLGEGEAHGLRAPEALQPPPIQYDELRIEHEERTVEIVVYDRAILLFTTESEAVRRIHRVCGRLDDIAGRRWRA